MYQNIYLHSGIYQRAGILYDQRSSMTDQNHATTKVDKPRVVGEQPHKQAETAAQRATPWPAITLGIVGTVFILAAIATAWLYFFSLSNEVSYEAQTYSEQRDQYYDDEPYLREYGDRRGQPVASGVVSEISGDTLTVIGGGDKVSVKQSNATRIVGDESTVAINDTVLIFGSQNDDGSVSATRIVIRNNLLQDEPNLLETSPRSPRLPSA